MLFGGLALAMCYSTKPAMFFRWLIMLFVLAAILNFLDAWVLQRFDSTKSEGNWPKTWVLINVIQLVVTWFVADWESPMSHYVPWISLEWSVSVTILLPIYSGLLVWDVVHQLDVLKTRP